MGMNSEWGVVRYRERVVLLQWPHSKEYFLYLEIHGFPFLWVKVVNE